MATAGRPTKYTPDHLIKVDEYLAICNDEYTRELVKNSDGKESVKLQKVNIPSHEGFASYLNVNTSSLYEWAKENEAFSKALDKIKEKQKERLLAKGLSGEYNPVIAKLILSANHGMYEKTQVENKVSFEEELSNEQIEQIAKRTITPRKAQG